MLFLIRCLSATVLAALVSVSLGWTSPAYMKLGGFAAIVCASLVAAVMWASRTKPVKGLRIPPSKTREVLIGGVSAALWVGLVQVYFFVALNTAAISDRDRPTIHRNASLLEDAGNHEAASSILLEALENPHTDAFKRDLAERAVLDLTRAAESKVGPDRERLLEKAISIATRYGLPADLPSLALKRLTDADAITHFQSQVDAANARAKKADAEQAKLKADAAAAKQQAEALKQQTGAYGRSLKQIAASALRHGVSLSGNAIDGDLNAAYAALSALIRDTGTKEPTATDALQRLQRAINASLPATLPDGTRAEIKRVDTSLMAGLTLIDVEILDHAKKPLAGLTSKDFVAHQNGQRIRLTAAPFSTVESLLASILIDVSSSTSGRPIEATRIAVPNFVARLPSNAMVRLSSFSNSSTLLSDWTSNKERVGSAAQSIHADGGTALYQAVMQEVRTLAQKSGTRMIIVFSDGANSLPGPAPEAITAAARDANIAIHFVALKGAGYSDTSAIERIANETGGRTFLVEEASKLSDAFQALAASLNQTGYRLALLDHDRSLPCKLVVGAKGAVALDVAASRTAPITTLSTARN